MTKVFSSARKLSVSTLILLGVGLHLTAALSTYLAWRTTADARWVTVFFTYQGAFFFISCGVLEFCLCLFARWQFSPGEPLRRAWSFISAAAAARLAGGLFVHLLSVNSYLNPYLYFFDYWNESLAASLRQLGLVAGGPLAMAFLARGLYSVLRVYKKLDLLGRPTLFDGMLLGVVVLYTLWFLVELTGLSQEAIDALTIYELINWASDPLLSLLLFEAIILRRSVMNMGGGLVAKCWGALTAAVFLTSLGDIGMWAVSHGYLTEAQEAATWYIWFLASAAYALAPAYQVEALLQATGRSEALDARGDVRWLSAERIKLFPRPPS